MRVSVALVLSAALLASETAQADSNFLTSVRAKFSSLSSGIARLVSSGKVVADNQVFDLTLNCKSDEATCAKVKDNFLSLQKRISAAFKIYEPIKVLLDASHFKDSEIAKKHPDAPPPDPVFGGPCDSVLATTADIMDFYYFPIALAKQMKPNGTPKSGKGLKDCDVMIKVNLDAPFYFKTGAQGAIQEKQTDFEYASLFVLMNGFGLGTQLIRAGKEQLLIPGASVNETSKTSSWLEAGNIMEHFLYDESTDTKVSNLIKDIQEVKVNDTVDGAQVLERIKKNQKAHSAASKLFTIFDQAKVVFKAKDTLVHMDLKYTPWVLQRDKYVNTPDFLLADHKFMGKQLDATIKENMSKGKNYDAFGENTVKLFTALGLPSVLDETRRPLLLKDNPKTAEELKKAKESSGTILKKSIVFVIATLALTLA